MFAIFLSLQTLTLLLAPVKNSDMMTSFTLYYNYNTIFLSIAQSTLSWSTIVIMTRSNNEEIEKKFTLSGSVQIRQ